MIILICFENIRKWCKRSGPHINLTIEDGEFVSIIGLSGAGKSTLLRSINRLNDVRGEITINGVSVTKAGKKELPPDPAENRTHFTEFQSGKAQHCSEKNVLSGRLGYCSHMEKHSGTFSKEDYERTTDALERVGLLDKLHTRCDELSGGQQQRVSIARTLVQQADIILADEPVASLDPVTTQKIMKDLREHQQRHGQDCDRKHSFRGAGKNLSTRIIALKAGKWYLTGHRKN